MPGPPASVASSGIEPSVNVDPVTGVGLVGDAVAPQVPDTADVPNGDPVEPPRPAVGGKLAIPVVGHAVILPRAVGDVGVSVPGLRRIVPNGLAALPMGDGEFATPLGDVAAPELDSICAKLEPLPSKITTAAIRNRFRILNLLHS
jgi:hypothetical protein